MTNLLDLQRESIKNSADQEEFEEFRKEVKKKLNIFTFFEGTKSNQLVSKYNNTHVFIETGHEEKVSLGETWICVTEFKYNYYYVIPIIKVTPGFIINLDSDVRESVIRDLWIKNRKLFENEFEKRYKEEISETVTAEMEAKYKTKINSLTDRITELETMNQHNNFLLQNTAQQVVEEGIELGSDEMELGIEMESGELNVSMPSPPPRRVSPPIPYSRSRTMPGFPEMRGSAEEISKVPDGAKYIVERTGDDTIYSESFTDLKYFIHISPSMDMLVIRPNEFGNAYSVNRSITLKGLGKLSPFKERKVLNAEFSQKYDGLVVYL